jgi:hypothetical protein
MDQGCCPRPARERVQRANADRADEGTTAVARAPARAAIPSIATIRPGSRKSRLSQRRPRDALVAMPIGERYSRSMRGSRLSRAGATFPLAFAPIGEAFRQFEHRAPLHPVAVGSSASGRAQRRLDAQVSNRSQANGLYMTSIGSPGSPPFFRSRSFEDILDIFRKRS